MLKLFILLGFTVGFCNKQSAPTKTETYSVGGVEFKMIGVAAGTFVMGAQADDPQGVNYDSEAKPIEGPVHNVTFTKDYYIGETEVTQALWIAVMGSNPSFFQSSTDAVYTSRENHPVEQVSWEDVVGTSGGIAYTINGVTYYQNGFCYKLSQLVGGGKQFRLPTEAEWEYAARGAEGIPDCHCRNGDRISGGGVSGKQTKYSGSDNIDDVGWCIDNIPSTIDNTLGYGTQEVKMKQANSLGVYDMSGNVGEWCSDRCSDLTDSYIGVDEIDPIGSHNDYYRVIRSGSWRGIAGYCGVFVRGRYTPNDRRDHVGFRLVLGAK